MSTDLEHDLRAAFDELAGATRISPYPQFGDQHALPAAHARRSWPAITAVAACVVLVGSLALVVSDRARGSDRLDTLPAATVASQQQFLFPSSTAPTRFVDPRDAVDAYLADRVTTAPAGQTVTYIVYPDGPPFDGSADQVLIGFSLTVTPDDTELCCDSGDGVARLTRVDGAWFVTSAEIIAMHVYEMAYSDAGELSAAFSPTIAGFYTAIVDDFGWPGGPAEDGVGAEHVPDPGDAENGPNFRMVGYTAPAVSVRIWHTPTERNPYPAAMFAEFIVPRGVGNVANISLDP